MDLFVHYLSLPYLIWGIGLTLGVTALGLGGGLLIGVLLAAMQLSRFRALSAVARAYAVIFRGTPLILQMVFAYDALPHVGVRLSAMASAGLALAFNEAPFIAEILRSGVRGVDSGQVAAGQALGMTPGVLMRHVIAPQAIRLMVPALGNEAVSALKNSSLASVVSVQELTLRSTQLASSTFDFFSIFFASGVFYLALTGGVSGLQLIIEVLLDLDRPPPRDRLRRFLPWHRATIVPASPVAGGSQPASRERLAAAPPPAGTAARAVRSSPPGPGKPMVEAFGLYKSYGDRIVLAGLDLTVRAGEVIALLGPSGSGKSTLLRCINLLEECDSGVVRIGGQPLGFGENGLRVPPRVLAKERATIGVGMVFQQFNLFGHLTAQENVAGPLRWVHGMSRAAAERRARELLERVGLLDRAGALPRHLSGGQQQRVAIARALAPNPSVLLLDEPTSALDPELINEVLEVIRRLAVEDGLTMIISTHQLRFAEEVASRVVFLSNGSIVEQGPAREVLTRPCHPLTARFLHAMDEGRAPEPPPDRRREQRHPAC
ncbi:MAG TPA: amino acid ABC transporter permease/ATP-binding protein [Stellaceae bacterium]|nr:amino acid ABC transporter permease/ATP-binding protein [Stellaceae bacterium]